MFRTDLGADEGMLFCFPAAEIRSFWMRNTPLPLSVAYLDEAGRIVQIEDMEPFDERSHPSRVPAPFALEVHQGWFRRKRIRVGDRVEGLQEVFRRPSLAPR